MSVTPHVARVKTVYRRILKNYFDWFHLSRHRYAEKCTEARDAFEANRHLTDPGQIELAVREGEEHALRTLSGEPYRVQRLPGGNMFGRNVPFPLDFIKNPPRPIIP